MALSRLLTSISLTLLVYRAFKLIQFVYSGFITSPLRYLPGPKNSSIIYGNLKDIYQENSVLHEKWVAEHGNTIKYKGLAGQYLSEAVGSPKQSWTDPWTWSPCVKGDKHKQQRKIMNPAFGAAQIRDLTEIFVEKFILLRNIWASEIAKEGEVRHIDVLSWLNKMTLDIIGMADFYYKFDALDRTEKNELNEAFSKIFCASTKFSILPFVRAMFPILRFIALERDAEAKSARNTMDLIRNELLRNSKAAIFDANGTEVEKSSLRGRDLLSLLIRANLAKDLPESQRMNDEDVLAQVPTFLVAGHETTSPDVQVKLREELLKVSTDNPTMDELNGLPYLDAVVRETLRVHQPEASTIRIAAKDAILRRSPHSKPQYVIRG